MILQGRFCGKIVWCQDDKKFNIFYFYYFFNIEKVIRMKNEKVVLFKILINYEIFYFLFYILECIVFIERGVFIFFQVGERKCFYFLGYFGEQIFSGDDGVGFVVQRIRVCGYELWCWGFEFFFVYNRLKKGRIFFFGGRKIMIGLVDLKLWNL